MINDKNQVRDLITKDLRKSGYTLTSFSDRGRTYHVLAKKGNKKYYVKIAKSRRENVLLQNSIIFNRNLSKLNPPFIFPTVTLTGRLLNDYHYRVETEVAGTPFALMESDLSILQIKNPTKYFSLIYDLIRWLQKQNMNLPTSVDIQLGALQKNHKQKITNTMIKWSYNSTPRLSDLLKIVQKNISVFKLTTAHRDITPINIIITKQDKIGLIDTDLVKKAPKYYDVAEFYNRLWTRVCRPDLAKKFLKEVLSETKGNKDYLLNQFLAISAFRAVGNYYEVMHLKNNQEKRLKYLTSYSDNIADKEFLV